MKTICMLLVMVFSLALNVGCSCNKEKVLTIPKKESANEYTAKNSPINVYNLDKYLFRDDVIYIDLRSTEMILEEGHIAGFKFIPFYDFIASYSGDNTLYKMRSGGQVGGFVAQYKQSEAIINSLFEKDKYIFFVSQGGSESGYAINLLIQLGCDGNLLYNVGGVMNPESMPSYKSVETNKYFVEGHGNLEMTFKYDFMEDLTPIE